MDKTEELLTRGVAKIYPSKDELGKKLQEGRKLKVYQGFDATSPQLHIGHMVGLRKLRQWQDLGHQVIFLIGDFTSTIGDPSGKDTARTPLTHEEVITNAKTYKEQAGKILRFDGSNPAKILFNSEWLGKMSATDFLKLATQVTLGQVSERDMFQKRLKKGGEVYLNEFLYPIMQAYDSVEMDVDVEVGGEDQTFNMLMGRKLMRNMKKKEKFVMTTPLLTDAQGKKIGKTEGNTIALNDSPSNLFAKIMALGDDVIVKGLEYLTDVPMERIKHIGSEIARKEHVIVHKKDLAYEIVKQLYDHDTAHQVKEAFGKESLNLTRISIPRTQISTASVAKIMFESGLASSVSEAKRVTSQGGTIINNQVITNPNAPAEDFIKDDKIIIKRGDRRGTEIDVK